MGLSYELISQFAKVTKNDKKENKETTVYGKAVVKNGVTYVQIDGSDRLTPMSTTTEMKDGERVTATIKNHTIVVTGNISSPAARTDTVKEVSNKVTAQDNTITAINNKVEAHDNTITSINNTITEIGNTVNSQGNKITEINNTVNSQGNTIESLNNTVEAQGNDITVIDNTVKSQGNQIASINNTVTSQGNSIDAINNDIRIYNSSFQITNDIVTGIKGVNTDWITTKDLETDHATITSLDTKYANVDFANIQMAAIQKLFTDSGIIDNLVVEDGKITGKLVGVTIIGDLIEGGTVKADKLVVKGTDGLFYKLNTDGVSITAEQTDYNSLNGSVITAKSVTAEKISVSDLVAFGATIGGFHITDDAIYSGAKESAVNTTRGIFLNNDGEIAFGDAADFVKFYKDQNGDYKLEISAKDISIFSEDDANYTLTETEPSDWSTNYISYYIKTDDGYASITGDTAPTWEADKYYSYEDSRLSVATSLSNINQTGRSIITKIQAVEDVLNDSVSEANYTLTETEPSDWSTNYISYYIKTDDGYASITGITAPTWEADKYYSYENSRLSVAESMIQQLVDRISMIVTDENGTSLWEQTSDGWTFSINDVNKSLSDTSDSLIKLTDSVMDTNYALTETEPSDWSTNYISYYIKTDDGYASITGITAPTWEADKYYYSIKQNMSELRIQTKELEDKTAYISMGTDDNDNPCLELGKSESDFKLQVTNESINFFDGTTKVAYVTNKKLNIDNAVIENELQLGDNEGGFVWAKRSNGNMGLRWVGGDS